MFTKIHLFFGLFLIAHLSTSQTILKHTSAEENKFTIEETALQTITQKITKSTPVHNNILKGTQEKTLKVLANGFPKAIEVVPFFHGDASIQELPGQTIPTKLKSTTTYTLLKHV